MYYEDCLLARKMVLKKAKATQASKESVLFNQFQIASTDRLLLMTGNKWKDFLRYAMKYPQYAINDVGNHANTNRTVKWSILMVSFLIMYFLAPECASILSGLFPVISSEALCAVLSPLFLVIACFLGIIVIMELFLLFAAKCGKFPDELVDVSKLGEG